MYKISLTDKQAKTLLIISVVLLSILYLPNFNQPPIEFQNSTTRFVIHIIFFITLGLTIILALQFIKNSTIKLLYNIFVALPIFCFVLIGLFISYVDNGIGFVDCVEYKIPKSDEIIIYQSIPRSFASKRRYIKAYPITSSIRWFKQIPESEVDLNTFIRIKEK